MGKHFFEKRCHYSIRKFTIGAASVLLGMMVVGASPVLAEETTNTANEIKKNKKCARDHLR